MSHVGDLLACLGEGGPGAVQDVGFDRQWVPVLGGVFPSHYILDQFHERFDQGKHDKGQGNIEDSMGDRDLAGESDAAERPLDKAVENRQEGEKDNDSYYLVQDMGHRGTLGLTVGPDRGQQGGCAGAHVGPQYEWHGYPEPLGASRYHP